jgi:hypothetical protein
MTSTTPLTVSAAAFASGADIPQNFTCDGSDVSPALEWSAPPEGTETFAVIMEDPDAPGRTWVHWVLYDLPAALHGLPEGVPADGELASGARQGRNDFGKVGYGGPCPPPGLAHRYHFKLYALDKTLGLPAGTTKPAVERAMRGHIVATAEFTGRYRRSGR